MFKKILVPLDGSELAAKILPKVEELAKLVDAHVTLISVSSEATDVAGMASPEIFKEAARHGARPVRCIWKPLLRSCKEGVSRLIRSVWKASQPGQLLSMPKKTRLT